MKVLWICAVVLTTAATLSATQSSYSNTSGTVTQSQSNILTIGIAFLQTLGQFDQAGELEWKRRAWSRSRPATSFSPKARLAISR